MKNTRRPSSPLLSTLATFTLAGLATVSGTNAYAAIDVLDTVIATDSTTTPPTELPVTSSLGDQTFSDTTQITLFGPTSSLSVNGGSTLTVGGIATLLGTSGTIITRPTDGGFLVQSVNPAPSVFVSGTGSQLVLTGYTTTDANGLVLIDTPRVLLGSGGNLVIEAGAIVDGAGAASTGSQGAMVIGSTIGADAELRIDGAGSLVRAPSMLIVGDDGISLSTSIGPGTITPRVTISNGGRLEGNTVVLGNGIDAPLLLDAIAQGQFFGATTAAASLSGTGTTLQATRLEIGAHAYSEAELTVGSGANVLVGSEGLAVGAGSGVTAAFGGVTIQNGGTLQASGTIDIAPAAPGALFEPEPASSGFIDIQAGGALTSSGSLRVLNGGGLFGSPDSSGASPALPDGVLTVDALELFRGGTINDAHLDFSNIKRFVLHEGAFFSTDGDPDLGAALVGLTGTEGSVGTVIITGGSAQVAANLGVGVGTGNVGSVNVTGTLETFGVLSVYGSMQIGTLGGQGDVTIGDNAFLAFSPSLDTTTATGPTLEIGSGGELNVVGEGSSVFGAEEINVAGGTLNVADNGVTFSARVTASQGGVINAGGIDIGSDVGIFGKGVGAAVFSSEITPLTPPTVEVRGTGTSVNLDADGFVLDAETQEPLGPLARLVIRNTGQVSILEGAQLNANAPSPISGGANTVIGDLLGSSARVLVDGAGSTLRTADQLIIGNDGFDPALISDALPVLEIRNAGTVVSENAIVSAGVDNPDVTEPAARTAGVARVDGTGSMWNTQSLDIAAAERASGQVFVTNGGALNIGTGGLRVGNGGLETDGTSGVLSLDTGATATVTTDRSQLAAIRIGFDHDSSVAPPFDPNGDVVPSGVLALSNGSRFTVNALDADGRVLVGHEGFGTLNIASGSQFVVNGTGAEVTETLNAGLIAGVFDVGDPLAHGTVLVDGAGSLLKVTHNGSTARLIVGTGPSDPTYTGTGSATGEMRITNGATVRVEGIQQHSRIWVGEGSNATGTIVVSGADSTLELLGANNVLFVGLDNPITESAGTAAGVVRIENGGRLNLGAAAPGSPVGASAVVIGQSGRGRLEVANATANIQGDLAVFGGPANTVQIEGGGSINVSGTTFVAGTVRGLPADSLVGPTALAANTLSSNRIELYGGGTLDDTHLDLRDVQTFSILDGASFRTAKTYDIGGNQISALDLIDGDLTAQSDLNIGTDSASSGTVTVSGTSELFVSGVLRVGGAGTGSLLLSDNATGLAVGSGSADSSAIVIGNGGSVGVSDNAALVTSQTLAVDGGSLTVADNGFASADLLQVSAGSVTAGGLFLTQEGFVRLGGAGVVEFASDAISFESGVETAGVVIDGADTVVRLNGGNATAPSATLDRRLVIAGQQRMEITGGAEVDASAAASGSQGDSIIGTQLGQSATLVVSGTDSTLRTGGTLVIGGDGADPQNGAQNGTATLEALGGAKLFSDRVAISGGVNNPAITDPNIRTQGLAQIADVGTVWTMNKLAVAGASQSVGSLQVADGAVVNVNGPVAIGRGTSALGTVSVIDGAAALNITAGTGPALEIGVDTTTADGLVGGGGLLVEGGTVRIDATAGGDSRVVVGRLGQGTVNIGAGGAFVVDAAGTTQGGLGIGTNGGVGSFNLVGDAFGSASATIRHAGNTARVGVGVSDDTTTNSSTTGELVLAGPSNLLIEGIGQAAELFIGSGPGATGEVSINGTADGAATLTVRGTTARVVVGANSDGQSGQSVLRVGSVSSGPVSNVQALNSESISPTAEPDGSTESTAVAGSTLNVAPTVAGSGRLDIGVGSNGGLLEVGADGSVNVDGDINVGASTQSPTTETGGQVSIAAGGVVSASGTTRIRKGQVGGAGTLATRFLELQAGGTLDDTQLNLQGVQTLSILQGAVFQTAKVYDIGADQIGAIDLLSGDMIANANLGIGEGEGSNGTVTASDNSELLVFGVARVGGAGSGSLVLTETANMLAFAPETSDGLAMIIGTGGTVEVRDNAALIVNQQLAVNGGTLSTNGQGLVGVAGDLRIGTGGNTDISGLLTADGTVLVDGGRLELSATGRANVAGLAIDNGGVTIADFVDVASTTSVAGGLTGTLSVTGTQTITPADVTPQAASANLVLAGAGTRLVASRQLGIGLRGGVAAVDVGNSAEVTVGAGGLAVGDNDADASLNVFTNGIVNIAATAEHTALVVGSGSASLASQTGAGRVVLSQEASLTVSANSNGNGLAIIGNGGNGTLAVDSGGRFSIDASGTAQAGLLVGAKTGDSFSRGLVAIDGGGSLLEVRHSGRRAELAVGTCTESGCAGDGFGSGSVFVTGGGELLVAGDAQAAAVTVAASADSNGQIDIAGAGSSLSITGTDASLAIGTGTAESLSGAVPVPAGVVRVSDGGSLVVAGTASSTILVGSGSNGGRLTVDNATASVAGDLDIARAATTGSTGNGQVQIGNGGVMTVTGTTRVFAGGSLGGFDTASAFPNPFPGPMFILTDQLVATAALGADGILRTPILELYAGGSIDIDNLQIEGLQEFRLFEGATVSSSLEAFIGDNVSRVKAQGATIALGNVLGVGTTTANAGVLDLASGSSADVDGFVSVGGELGSGRINVLTGSTLRVRSAASGPGALGVGSAGTLSVAGAQSHVELDGRLIVDGGDVNLANSAGFAIGGLDLLNGSVSTSATNGSIFGSIVIGGASGTAANLDLIEESLITANVSSVSIGSGAGSAQVDIAGSTFEVVAQGESTLDFAIGSSGTVRVGNGGELGVFGDIDLNGGLLAIDGTGQVFARNLNAGAGARVTGTGRLTLDGALLAGAGSTLSPGNSPGLLTINGDLTIDGGTVLIEMAGADPGQYDVVRVEGDFAFNSGAFNLSLLEGFTPAGNSEFRVFEVRDALTVNTGAVTFGYVGMGPDYTFSVRDYTETIGSVTDTYQGGFVTFVAQDIAPTPGLTPNETALAETLDELCPRVEGLSDPTQDEADLDRICGGLRNGDNSEEQVQTALEALSPEEVANTLNTVLRFTSVQHGNLSQRINGLRYGVKQIDFSGVNLQFDEHYIAGRDIERALEGLIGGAASADEDFSRWGFFGNAAMNRGDKDATSNDAGFDFDGTVLSFGADYRVQDNLFVGGALGYNDLTADFQAGGGLDFQSISASLFGTWLYQEQGYVDALVTYGQSETQTDRLVQYDDAIGSVDRMASGDADGSQLLASVGGGWDFARGAFIFGPHVGFNYVESTVDKFDETGAQGANLSIPEQETRSLTGNLGMHLSYTWTPSFGVLVPNVRLDWVREFEDQAETVNIRFVNDRFSQDPLDPSLPFAVQNDAPDGEYLSWSVGASAQFINGIAAFVNYRGNAMQKDITLGELTLGIRMEKAF